jgi:flagellar hook-associated protein 2
MSQGGISAASLNSLWNNPQLLQQVFPSINVAGLQGVLNAELAQVDAPVQQLSSEQQTLSAQASAYSNIQAALQKVQTDAQALEQATAFDQAGTPVSSDPNLVSASGSGAPPGTYQVAVSSLEQNAILASSAQSVGTSTPLGWSGTLTVEVGDPGSQTAVSVNVSASDSLATLAQNLTGAAAQALPQGETLSALSLPTSGGGSQLVLSVNGALTAADVTATGTFPGLTFSQVQSYQPAAYSVDGVQNTANSNAVTDALPGVTLNLLGTTPSGQPVTLTASADPSATASQVASLVSDIQSAVTAISQATAQGQPLAGDPTLSLASDQLIQALTSAASGQPSGFQSLTDMGLTMTYTQGSGGALSFDSSAFTSALASDPGAVTALFTTQGSGLAYQIAQIAADFATPQTGILAQDQQNIQNQDQLISSQEGAVQALVTQEQSQLESQFMANLQTLVNNASQLQFIQQYVAQQNGTATASGQGGQVG